MSAKLIKAIKFSLSTTDNENKYFLFGDEHILMYQVKNHCLKTLDIKLLEKFYIDIADENFDAKLDQCLMSNSLFNEKKVVFLALSKNRLNKELVERFKKIMAYETDNILITEITNLSKNATAEDKEGIELTLKSFESTLDKFGMVPIYPDNEEFNPEKHEAVSMEQNKDKKDGYVGNIMQRGWELHSRVLRPARVTVVKN